MARGFNRLGERWEAGVPSASDVRPYSPNFGDDLAFDAPGLITAFIKSADYKAGDVIWVDAGSGDDTARLARIVGLGAERGRWGDRRLVLYVQLAMADGSRWSRVKRRTWPGFVQRGYAGKGDAVALAEVAAKEEGLA